VLARIDTLMRKGEGNLTQEEETELRSLALAMQAYEDRIYTIPPGSTLEGINELVMYEQRLNYLQDKKNWLP
jgi:HTH-type transcriptional regulator/antitoxin HigA